MLFIASITNLLKIHFNLMATTNTTSAASLFVTLIFTVLALAFAIFIIISTWKVFEKAGRHGWCAIIPVYSTWVIFEIGGYPGWWAILQLIPFVNIVALVVYAMAVIQIARRFGKGFWFGFLGLFWFSFIGWPILAFGKSQYNNPDNPPLNNPNLSPTPPTTNNNFPSNPLITTNNVIPTTPTVVSSVMPQAPTTNNVITTTPTVVSSVMPQAPTTDNVIPTTPTGNNNLAESSPINNTNPNYP